MFAALNASLRGAFDLLLSPFEQLPPIVGLAVVSAVTAAAMLLVLKATSDQARIVAIKRAIAASLFEIRLFNDDLAAVFRAQAEILRHNLTYLRLSLVPMLWMIVPLSLVVAHLEYRYGYGGLTPGVPVLLTAHVPQTAGGDSQDAIRTYAAAPAATLETPPQVQVLTPAVWFPRTQEVIWQVQPVTSGHYEVTARIAGQTFTKTFEATDRVVNRSPVRTGPGIVSEFLYSSERPLPADAAVSALTVPYPPRRIDVFGWELPWVAVYLALSMLFALALKKPFKVSF